MVIFFSFFFLLYSFHSLSCTVYSFSECHGEWEHLNINRRHFAVLEEAPCWERRAAVKMAVCVFVSLLFFFFFFLYCNFCVFCSDLDLMLVFRMERRFRGAFFWFGVFSLLLSFFFFCIFQYLSRGSLIIMFEKYALDRTYLLWLSSEPLNSLYLSYAVNILNIFFFLQLIGCQCVRTRVTVSLRVCC